MSVNEQDGNILGAGSFFPSCVPQKVFIGAKKMACAEDILLSNQCFQGIFLLYIFFLFA